MRTWQAALGGITAMTLLSACGGGFADESATTILEETEKDMKALSSVRVAGEMTQDGESVALDMVVSTSGDCEGTLEIQDGTAEIRSVGGESWMKPDDAFWESFAGEQAALIQGVVGDNWVVLPEDEGDFSEFCDLDELLEDTGDDDKAEPEKDGTEEVDGQETVRLTSETDDGDPTKVWVTVDDPHHILKMEVESGDEPGTITFSDFDEELEVQAPAEDEVVDLNELGSQEG